MPDTPPCPITGEAGSRLIQRVPANLLIGLWKAAFRIDTRRLLGPGREFGLWESPCGLVFFEPRVAADGEFYRTLYPAWTRDGPWSGDASARQDYLRAARLVRPGDAVLDVGCGAGAFAPFVAHGRYTGLDDNYPAAGLERDIRNEALAAHAAGHAGAYDVVCAFHVLEHVADPGSFARELAHCIRPGGLLVIAVPKYPSALNDIPDCMFNAPPHHLTWWSEPALAALAAAAGLQVRSLEGLPLGAHHRLGHWMGRTAPPLTGEVYFRASRWWYCALAWSALAGLVCSTLLGTPRKAPPIELLLVAARPPA